MVNWWCGTLGMHPSDNPFHKGILRIQTTNPNQQWTIGWAKTSNKTHFYRQTFCFFCPRFAQLRWWEFQSHLPSDNWQSQLSHYKWTNSSEKRCPKQGVLETSHDSKAFGEAKDGKGTNKWKASVLLGKNCKILPNSKKGRFLETCVWYQPENLPTTLLSEDSPNQKWIDPLLSQNSIQETQCQRQRADQKDNFLRLSSCFVHFFSLPSVSFDKILGISLAIHPNLPGLSAPNCQWLLSSTKAGKPEFDSKAR